MDSDVQEVPIDTDDVVVVEPTTVPNPSAPRDEPLEQLEKALENACESLASLATNVIDFSYDSQGLLFTKVNEFVKDLQQIDDKSKLVDASIPIDVIETIDKGRNPEHCTYQMLESCAEANNIARGKLDVMRQFRDALGKSIDEEPEEGKQTTKNENKDKVMDIDTETAGVTTTGNPTNGF